MSKEQYNVYTNSLMAYWESKGSIDTARDEGKLEGRIEEKVEVAKRAIPLGMTNEQISMLTGLSVEEIQDLR